MEINHKYSNVLNNIILCNINFLELNVYLIFLKKNDFYIKNVYLLLLNHYRKAIKLNFSLIIKQ